MVRVAASVLVLLDMCAAFTPTGQLPRTSMSRRQQPCRVSRPPRLAEDEDEVKNAFAAFGASLRKPKKGEGAPTREASFPIRLGGSTRDGSLGDIRAAVNSAKTLSNPKDWQAEEIGLIGVFVAFIAATSFLYNTYVADKPPPEAKASPAQAALQKALADCGDQACLDRVYAEKEPAVIQERQLDNCMDKAFSNTERNICKRKFGGAATPFGF